MGGGGQWECKAADGLQMCPHTWPLLSAATPALFGSGLPSPAVIMPVAGKAPSPRS